MSEVFVISTNTCDGEEMRWITYHRFLSEKFFDEERGLRRTAPSIVTLDSGSFLIVSHLPNCVYLFEQYDNIRQSK